MQRVDARARPELVEDLLLVGRAAAARRRGGDVPGRAERRGALARHVQEVQLQLARDLPEAATPRTLLPCGSSRGEKTAIPIWPGRTASTPPPTPLLAGRPTSATHSPAASYMPQVVITLSTRSTTSGSNTRSPVRGWTPPLASVAAISARSRQSTCERALAEVELDGRVRVAVDHARRRAAGGRSPGGGGRSRSRPRRCPASIARSRLAQLREERADALEALLGRVARRSATRRRSRPR